MWIHESLQIILKVYLSNIIMENWIHTYVKNKNIKMINLLVTITLTMKDQ
jgi:hypothetical protein